MNYLQLIATIVPGSLMAYSLMRLFLSNTPFVERSIYRPRVSGFRLMYGRLSK